VILVDTSVWIDHLRSGVDEVTAALEEGEVLTHSFVIGELSCGNIRNRAEILSLLEDLPTCREAMHGEVMELVERRRLMGRGIGYVDAHLLAATVLTPSARLFTREKRLAKIATELGINVTR
jgi:predicted nucleic acid-binding protein